ncbi:uncharacterized protein [Anabrus simplex]|uniref:uncharacterized protein n=1 Tax=Anabrus simplex TaxID=316456 RepID=UPI0035A34E1C
MGGLILKLKCRSCGFKSMPIRGDRCRRCNRQIPEAQKKPVSKELFRPSPGEGNTSVVRGLVKESTLTKILKKKQEILKKREEALRRKQQEHERQLEFQHQEESLYQQEIQPELQRQPELSEKVPNVQNERNKPNRNMQLYRTPSLYGLAPDKFPPVELIDDEVTRQVTAKEPPVREFDSDELLLDMWRNRDDDLLDLVDGSLTGYFTLVSCNSVRIGSYKVIPEEKVILSTVGIWICIPTIRDPEQKITLTIDIFEIEKVLAFYSKPATLFVYVIPSAVKRIQKLLDMNPEEGPFFDPRSSDETMKRITLLCMPLHVDSIKSIREIFGHLHMLEELTADESNDLLVRSSPKYAPFHSDMVSLFV